MPLANIPRPPSRRHGIAVAALVVCGANACAQESSPYYVGVSQGFASQSNVFRAPSGSEVSDTISSTGVLGGLNLTFGRQRVYADFTANANKHQNLEQLDNTSYSINSGLNWQTVEHLSGGLRYVARQNLGDYGVPGAEQVKNVERVRQASASVRYAMLSNLGFEGSAEHRMLKHSHLTRNDSESRVGSLSVRWGAPGSLLTLALGGRVTKGESPNFQPIIIVSPGIPGVTPPVFGFGPVEPDDVDRKDLDLTAVWTPSALSTVTGRISKTRENHSVASLPDFSGVTGSLDWNYRPTGKLALNASLVRDTGVQTTFSQLLPPIPLPGVDPTTIRTDNNRINTVMGLDANYELTAKIGLSASYRRSNSELIDASGNSFDDKSNRYSLGARYQVLRTVSVSCNYSRETRENYGANITGCTAQFVLP